MNLAASPLDIARTPITLEGSVVLLEPIRRDHAGIFWDVAKDDLDNIFQWIPYRMKSREDLEQVVEHGLDGVVERPADAAVAKEAVDRSEVRLVVRAVEADLANGTSGWCLRSVGGSDLGAFGLRPTR